MPCKHLQYNNYFSHFNHRELGYRLVSGLLELWVLGHIQADRLTQSQPEGADCSHQITPDFQGLSTTLSLVSNKTLLPRLMCIPPRLNNRRSAKMVASKDLVVQEGRPRHEMQHEQNHGISERKPYRYRYPYHCSPLCDEMEFTLTFQISKILAHNRLYLVFIKKLPKCQHGFYCYYHLVRIKSI